jgi:hypothetical protein
MALRSTLTSSIPVGARDAKGGGAVKRRAIEAGASEKGRRQRAVRQPHRVHGRANSPTKCESSASTSTATGTGAQTLVAATVEMSSMRGRSGIRLELIDLAGEATQLGDLLACDQATGAGGWLPESWLDTVKLARLIQRPTRSDRSSSGHSTSRCHSSRLTVRVRSATRPWR